MATALKIDKINHGSYHLRVINAGDTSTYPPYTAHVIIEPTDDGGCEIKGLDSAITKHTHKLFLDFCKRYFRYAIVTRIKNDKPIIKRWDFE